MLHHFFLNLPKEVRGASSLETAHLVLITASMRKARPNNLRNFRYLDKLYCRAKIRVTHYVVNTFLSAPSMDMRCRNAMLELLRRTNKTGGCRAGPTQSVLGPRLPRAVCDSGTQLMQLLPSRRCVAMCICVQLPHKLSRCGNWTGRNHKAVVKLTYPIRPSYVSSAEIKCDT